MLPIPTFNFDFNLKLFSLSDPWSAGGVLKDNFHLFGLEQLNGNALVKTVFEYFGTFSTKNLNNTIFTNGPIIINIPNAVHHEDLRETGRCFIFGQFHRSKK